MFTAERIEAGMEGFIDRAAPPQNGANEITGDVQAEQIAGTLQHENGETALPAEEPGGMGMLWLAVYGLIFVGMWFVLIRPQRKRDKAMKELQASISTGDKIVTSGGLFGQVVDIGEDCFVVEFGTNRGVRIPILKADVVCVREPKTTPQPKIEQ